MREVLRSEGPSGFIMRTLRKTVGPFVWLERGGIVAVAK